MIDKGRVASDPPFAPSAVLALTLSREPCLPAVAPHSGAKAGAFFYPARPRQNAFLGLDEVLHLAFELR